MPLRPSVGLWYKERKRRRTQVAKGAVCKTAIRRFNPARRLQFSRYHPFNTTRSFSTSFSSHQTNAE